MTAGRPDPLWDPGRGASGYDRRFDELAARGENVHGEADFVQSLGVRSVLDAGCGTGRVAIELARRGIDVIGVDSSREMIGTARRKAPNLAWVVGDLVNVRVRRVDAVLMAGNVMLFLRPGTAEAVIGNLAAHLVAGGLLVNGFQLLPDQLDLARYDAICEAAGLEPAGRWGTWDRKPYLGGRYAVSLHRLAVLA